MNAPESIDPRRTTDRTPDPAPVSQPTAEMPNGSAAFDVATRSYSNPELTRSYQPGTSGQSPEIAPPELGTPVIPGYEVLGVLGRGGMGVVYKARHLTLKRIVALKMVRAGAEASPAELQRFRSEAEAVARLQHPHIVQIHEFGEWQAQGNKAPLPYFCLEFIDGGSLQGYLAETPLTTDEAATLVETLARAVHHAHQHGIIHRDLKPANVLLQLKDSGRTDARTPSQTEDRATQENEALREQQVERAKGLASDSSASLLCTSTPLRDRLPKITDFGLAKQLDQDTGQTRTGAIMGTPAYMSPEQALGQTDRVGPPVDVYALGAILYECLTGRPPFRAASLLETLEQVRRQEPVPPAQMQPGVPRDLDIICLKCLLKEPGKRYASALELAEDLQRYREGKPIRARPLGRLARLGRWCRRNPALASLLAVLIVAFVLVSWNFRVAIRATAKEREAGIAQREALSESRSDNARLLLEQALKMGEEGDIDKTLFFLARAVGNAEKAGNRELELALRRQLSARSWGIHPLHGFLETTDVVALAVSPDGKSILTGSKPPSEGEKQPRLFKGTARLWDAQTLQPRGRPLSHSNEVSVVAFNPVGRTFLTTTENAAFLFDVETLRLRATLEHPKDSHHLKVAVFSPDGKFVLTGSRAGARFWNADTGEPVSSFLPHPDGVSFAGFSRNGSRAFTAGSAETPGSGEAQMWEVPSFKKLGKPFTHPGEVVSATIDSGGQLLFTCCRDGKLRVWKPGSETPTQVYPQRGGPLDLALSRNGRALLTAGTFGGRWAFAPGVGLQTFAPFQRPETIRSVAFGPSEELVLAAGGSSFQRIGEVRLKLSRNLVDVGAPLRQATNFYQALFTPEGDRVVTRSADGLVAVWQVLQVPTIGIGPGDRGIWGHEPLSRSGQLAIVGRQLYDTLSNRPLGPPLSHPTPLRKSVFSPDGRKVLLVGDEYDLSLHDTAPKGRTAKQLKHPGERKDSTVSSSDTVVAFSADGDTFASGSHDGQVQLWSANTGQPLGAPLRHRKNVGMLVFSPDGRLLFVDQPAADKDPPGIAIQVWNLAERKPLNLAIFPQGSITSAVFTRDSRSLLLAEYSGEIRRWSLNTGKPLGEPCLHQGVVLQMILSQNGKTMLTISADRTARLWETETGRPIGRALQHNQWLHCGAISADGALAVTGTSDGEVRLFDLRLSRPLGAPLRFPTAISQVCLTGDERHLLIALQNGRVHRIEMPVPRQGTTEELVRWIEELTGVELDEHGELRVLTPAVWQRRRGGIPGMPQEKSAEN